MGVSEDRVRVGFISRRASFSRHLRFFKEAGKEEMGLPLRSSSTTFERRAGNNRS